MRSTRGTSHPGPTCAGASAEHSVHERRARGRANWAGANRAGAAEAQAGSHAHAWGGGDWDASWAGAAEAKAGSHAPARGGRDWGAAGASAEHCWCGCVWLWCVVEAEEGLLRLESVNCR